MSLITRLTTATRAAVATWRDVFQHPAEVRSVSNASRIPLYDALWSYYTNQAFANLLAWSAYINEFHLYRHIRSIYNPVAAIVDFYADHVYAGRITPDGRPTPDGKRSGVPFTADMDQRLRLACSQVLRWSRWQDQGSVALLYGGATGNVLIELVDDVRNSRLFFNVVWPGQVVDFRLDLTGRLEFYALEYMALDEEGELYLYRKEVNAQEIRTFRDGAPFDYDGGGAARAGYGFVAAEWIRHKNIGSDFGAPAIDGDIPVIDEINSLASHLDDHLHKAMNTPFVLWTSSIPKPLFKGDVDPKDPEGGPDPRKTVTILRGDEGGSVSPLLDQIDLAGADAQIERLTKYLETRHPEIIAYRMLREMSQVTGPAAERVLGDVTHKLDKVSSNYDAGLARLLSMAVALGGERYRRGWSERDDKRALFAPFDLRSHLGDHLDIEIEDRDFLPLLESELVDLQQKRVQMADQATAMTGTREALRLMKYTDQEITRIERERAHEHSAAPVSQSLFGSES
ncbi:MAG: hypothetical protein U0Z53_29095 [Blastocatellia bacterium]